MPVMNVGADLALQYEIDDFTDPWRSPAPESVLLIPGVCDNGGVWFGVSPHLMRRYRVVRPDMRGFGRSTPMQGYTYSLDRLRDDYLALMDGLGIEAAHVVARRSGGLVAMHMAASRPDRVKTLALASSPLLPSGIPTPNSPALQKAYRDGGIRKWVLETNRRRVGASAPAAVADWLAEFMIENCPQSSLESFFESEKTIDLSVKFEAVRCPVLLMTVEGSLYGGVEQMKAVQRRIASSELVIIDSDGHDIVVIQPDVVARHIVKFIEKQTGAPGR